MRGYVLIDGKNISIHGSDGAILDGEDGERASAVVVSNGTVALENLIVRGFTPESPDDDIYDGHGVFLIDANARLSNMKFERLPKMAVSLRGSSMLTLENSELVDGHVGIWAEETAKAVVVDCLFKKNDSAGIAAYASSTVSVTGSIFEENLDDGVYAAESAEISIADSTFVRNSPYAVRSVEDAVIRIMSSRFHDNAEDRFPPEGDEGIRDRADE